MNDQDYICKAIELADGWKLDIGTVSNMPTYINTPTGYQDHMPGSQEVLDALAAQLVRQVDDAGLYFVKTDCSFIAIFTCPTREGGPYIKNSVEGKDRTMNTIKAVVDGKILEPQ